MLFGPHVGERFWAPLIANGSSASPKPDLVLAIYWIKIQVLSGARKGEATKPGQ